ncbi:MAG TPA: hypothetical protein VNR70_06600 [Steroidobacteraceae bacterium]|nr:hypothetical protein [Steroidobacteraceae bacterium]
MHGKFDLPDLFLAISLGMIAMEAALGSLTVIKARYRASDTFASLGAQAIIRDKDTWLSGSGGFDLQSPRAGG